MGSEHVLTMGTHSGTFQCDEALGIWMLRQLPRWASARLVRSRDQAVLETLDIVIDVGGTYNLEALRFDHHQRGFFETFDGEPGAATKPDEATGAFKTKLSACGLVYKHYGRELLSVLRPDLGGVGGARLEAVYVKLYKDMIEALDAIDNGIEVADEPRYREGTGLSSRIHRLNPKWNSPKVDRAGEDALFEEASALAGREFSEHLDGLSGCWLPARDLVEAALLERHQVHPSGAVICFTRGGMPWKEHLYDLERAHGCGANLVLFVLYEDQAGMWRVQAVTAEGTAFTNRLSLPAAWRGLRDEALSGAAGIDGCCFVHNAGFIGGHKTRAGALAMAVYTVEQQQQQQATAAP